MSNQITLEYLSKLLNKSIAEDSQITLSSAQKSRVHGWLIKAGIPFNESTLNGKFTIDQLLNGNSLRSTKTQTSASEFVSSTSNLNIGNAQIGIDIQRVDELFPIGLCLDPKASEELSQIFTVKELSYAQSKVDPEVTLTGIFCAKEAIQKISNIAKNLNEIEVLPDGSGRPTSNGYLLSISHSGNYAVAIAINTGEGLKVKNSLEMTEDLGLAKECGKLSGRGRFRTIRVTDLILFALIGFLFISRYYN